VRAFDPWPGTFTLLEGKLLKILRAHVGAGSGVPGTILTADAQGLVVACGQGALGVDVLQLEGRKRMGAAEFLAGHRLAPGAQLGR
jgi:methionyl-tRNA formyltransferase